MKIYKTSFSRMTASEVKKIEPIIEVEYDKEGFPQLGYDSSPYSGGVFVALTKEEAKAYLVMCATDNFIKCEKEYERAKKLLKEAQELQ